MKKTILTSASVLMAAMLACTSSMVAFADEDDDDVIDFTPDAWIVIQGEYKNDFVTTTVPAYRGDNSEMGISLSQLSGEGLSGNDLHVYRYRGDDLEPAEISSYSNGSQLCFTADGGDTLVISKGRLEKRWFSQEFEDDDD